MKKEFHESTDLPQDSSPIIDIGPEFHDWKKKSFLFLSGQAFSLFGSSLVQFAIIWYITLSTKSGTMMTISAICGFLPQIIISLFAGVWADRYSRKHMIIYADMAIATSTLVLAILFLVGYDQLWLLFLVSAIRSLGSGIQAPAINAMIPQLVPQHELMKYNGIASSVMSLTMLLSPAASGAILSVANLETTFFIDVVTAIIAISILFSIKIAPHKKAAERQDTGYLEDLKVGISYIRSHTPIMNLLVFFSLFFILITPAAFLTPLMIARSFGEEVWRLTLNEVMFSGGSILGGIIIAAWGGFKSKSTTIAFSGIGFGVLTFALGLSSIFWIYLVIMFITGIFLPFFNSSSIVLLQERVDPDIQGRVFGLVQIVMSTAMPIGMMVCGPLAEVVSVELQLIITGVLMTILGVVVILKKNLFE